MKRPRLIFAPWSTETSLCGTFAYIPGYVEYSTSPWHSYGCTMSTHSPADVRAVVSDLLISLSASIFVDLGWHFIGWTGVEQPKSTMYEHDVWELGTNYRSRKLIGLMAGLYIRRTLITLYNRRQSKITTTTLEQLSLSDLARKDGSSSGSSAHSLYVAILWALVMLDDQSEEREVPPDAGRTISLSMDLLSRQPQPWQPNRCIFR